MTLLELPELCDERLDEETLSALVKDIVTETELLEVRLKGQARRMVPGVKPAVKPTATNAGSGLPGELAQLAQLAQLEDALGKLREGSISGVQIRYLHQDVEWWDTLMVVSKGIRLVRIRRPS